MALERLAFEEGNFDGFLITNEMNLLYFTGFEGATCLLFLKDGENSIYVHGVNYEQAKTEGKGYKVKLVKINEHIMHEVSVEVKDLGIKKLAFDTLSFESYHTLNEALGGKTKLEKKDDLVWKLRKVKSQEELNLMRKAGELTTNGMKAAYETIRPGIREYEVAMEIEYAMRRGGSFGTAFETIVASGVRSAFPHGGCTEKKVQEGDLVVVDIGATYKNYRSDMTRTIVAGTPSSRQEKIYQIVKQAQEKSLKAVKSGVKAKSIDAIARKIIGNSGYEEHFVHGLGHGVGLEVHEPPVLNTESKDLLGIGNVVTIEPGIYIVGFGGIRIEDTVIVQKQRAEKVTDGFYSLTH
ncbi:MAG: Xaa-Pro peptidase family protein [Candidatus Bathyarchaeota archaeon]|jgi:Xaa-Pro dipeptidase